MKLGSFVCSVTPQNIVGKCETENSSCSKGQVCVLVEVQCVTTPCHPIEKCVDEVKPGQCPEENGLGICVVNCQGDAYCPGNQKCCGNCPRTCKEPKLELKRPEGCP